MAGFFQRESPRRKLLELLAEGDKELRQLAETTKFKSGKPYVWSLLAQLKKDGYVVKCGKGKVTMYSLTHKGRAFLKKDSIEEV
jgi:DNA-binding PadR family transcriptional regulator